MPAALRHFPIQLPEQVIRHPFGVLRRNEDAMADESQCFYLLRIPPENRRLEGYYETLRIGWRRAHPDLKFPRFHAQILARA